MSPLVSVDFVALVDCGVFVDYVARTRLSMIFGSGFASLFA
jgi:hypothetical protein